MSLRSVRNAIATLAIISLTAGAVLAPIMASAKAEEVVVALTLVAAVVVVPAAAVPAMGLGAEAVPAVPGVPAMVRVGAAEAVPAMGRAGVVAVDGVTIIAAMAGAAMAVM